MPLLRITDLKPDDEIRKAIKTAVEDAKVEWAPMEFQGFYPDSGFGIAELRVKHVPSYGNAYWGSCDFWAECFTASNTFEAWINGTMTDMAYVIVEGMFDLSPSPVWYEMGPTANGVDLPTINIQQMFALDVARVWLEKPFATRPNNQLKVQNKGKDATTEDLGLIGHCVAKRAYLIIR